MIGRPLSPYAVTKYVNELYADVFGRCYGLATIGLRYFNVFGPRQDPEGAYAAVIPRWVAAMMSRPRRASSTATARRRATSATSTTSCRRTCSRRWPTIRRASGQVYNVAAGQRTTLLQLHELLSTALRDESPDLLVQAPVFAGFRDGDVRHSLADIGKARSLLGYEPSHDVRAGLREAVGWYMTHLK